MFFKMCFLVGVNEICIQGGDGRRGREDRGGKEGGAVPAEGF